MMDEIGESIDAVFNEEIDKYVKIILDAYNEVDYKVYDLMEWYTLWSDSLLPDDLSDEDEGKIFTKVMTMAYGEDLEHCTKESEELRRKVEGI